MYFAAVAALCYATAIAVLSYARESVSLSVLARIATKAIYERDRITRQMSCPTEITYEVCTRESERENCETPRI